ncbi:MAG: BolA/IbaG family iron-sulfur metabolism protein [Psittacicella sp.]
MNIKEILLKVFPEAIIEVTSNGSNHEVILVSDKLEGVSRVQRYKDICAPLSSFFETGEIHAISIKSYTQKEWEKFSLLNGGL